MVCVYLATSLLKVNGGTWLDGTAMHFVLTNREVGRFDMSFLVEYPLLINFLTYAGLAIELSLAFFLWVKAGPAAWMILAAQHAARGHPAASSTS